MKRSALEYLVCNQCQSRLSLVETEVGTRPGAAEEEVLSGQLKCTGCPRIFPIERGVPRFVDRRGSSEQNLETGQRFGVAWKEFPRLDKRYKEQFFDWLNPVDPSFIQGKVVLEAGCGKGRHAHLIAEAGAKHVFAVDIGEAVDVAYENVGSMDRVHIIQSDILSLPFNQSFDFAFSVGVLHHMDVPEGGFRSIVNRLKPDGSVCVWVYGKENNWWLIHLINPLRLAITAKMPAGPLRLLAAMMALPVFVYAKLVAKPYMELKQRVPALPDLFYGAYLSYIARFDFNEIHHITFDHLVAPVSNYIPGSEVKQWFDRAGFDHAIIRWHNRNSWTGFASRKPGELDMAKGKLPSGAHLLSSP